MAKKGLNPIIFLFVGVVVILVSYYFILNDRKAFWAFLIIGIGLVGWGVYKMFFAKKKAQAQRQYQQGQYPQQGYQQYPQQGYQQQQYQQPQQGQYPQQGYQYPQQPPQQPGYPPQQR